MSEAVNWIVVGRFGKVHGVKGWVTVQSFTEPRENIVHYQPWHIYMNKQWQPINLMNVQLNDKHILALVEGHMTREQAALLTNCDIGIRAEALPALENDEYYWHELIGMQVINKDGTVLGSVSEMMPTGSNDVLVVKGEQRVLIPYLPGQFVLSVDKKKQQIHVDWDVNFS